MIQSQNQSQQSQVTSQQQQQQQQPDCRSEATSVCGDNSSVLSGFSGAVVGVPSTVTSTTSVTASKASIPSSIIANSDPLTKRDSLVKEAANIYVDAASVVQPQPSKNSVNDDLETSTVTAVSGKEW